MTKQTNSKMVEAVGLTRTNCGRAYQRHLNPNNVLLKKETIHFYSGREEVEELGIQIILIRWSPIKEIL
jgi:hypothetical protein